ncbi:MAG: hypothetical protein ABFR53_00645 [Actinomycetota bacterium]
MARTSASVPLWRRLAELLVFISASTAVIFVLSAVALVIYTQGTADPADVVLVIPEGSGEAITEGESVLDVPPVWTFNTGDTLTLDNRDAIEHTLGDWSAAPGRSLVIELEISDEGDHLTTLHPTGIMTVNVEPRGFDFSIIAFTTFAFGISIGIIAYVGFSIARAMGRNDDDDWVDG